MSDYIEVNNRITVQALENRDIDAIMPRIIAEYDMFSKYVNSDAFVLDLGSKDGLFLEVLRDHDYNNIVATDCCPEAIEILAAKGFDVVECDVQYLDMFDKDTFNAISIIHTLEHVPEPNLVVIECNRILKDNGIVFVEVPTQPWEAAEDWGHFHTFTNSRQVTEIFEAWGFKQLEMKTMNPPSKKPWNRYIFRRV